jgi:hypothetical protein
LDTLIVASISAGVSIVVALVGAWVAKKKGLPAINAEIESRNKALIDTLREQVDAMSLDYAGCRAKLTEALTENKLLRGRIARAENALADLYREVGKVPPPRLERHG